MDADTIYRRRWLTLMVLNLSLILIVLDNTVLNVAIPSLQRDLGATASELQWIVDAYVLVFAGLLLAAGSFGDRYGRKLALQSGLVILGVGSLFARFAEDPAQLIAIRAFMGVGGALVMPSTLSILTNVFPSHERARAIGIWAGVSGLGIAIGPITGGWLVEHFDWSAAFLMNVPIAILALLAGLRLVPESRDPASPPIDYPGALLSIVTLSVLIFTLIEAPSEGWTSARTIGGFALSAAVGAVFAWREVSARYPMLDLRFFESARFSAAGLAIAFTFMALFGSIFLITQLMQFVFGYSPLGAGARVAPIALAVMVGAITSSRSVPRVGAKIPVAIGLTVVAAALSFIALDPGSGYQRLLIGQLMIGLGMGLAVAPATDAVMGSLPLAKAGVGSAMNDAVRQVGGALGVAVLGSVQASRFGEVMAPAVEGLPAAAAEAASDSIGGALAVAQANGPGGAALAETARVAFADAMGDALFIAAGIALVGALLVARFLPAHEPRTQEEIDRAFGATPEAAPALEVAGDGS